MESKKLIIYILAFVSGVLCLGLVAFLGADLQFKKNASNYYKQGLEYYNKKDYQNAYYNFSRVYPSSEYFLNAVYKSAKCADNLGDVKTGVKKYSLLQNLSKNENIAPFALWRLGNLYCESGDKKEAKKTFLKLKETYKGSEYGIAANYMLSKLTDDLKKKKEYHLEYIKYSPKGRFAKSVLLQMISEDLNLLGSEEKTVLANCLYENGAYVRSVDTLKGVPLNLSWVYLLKALDKLNSSNNVVKVAGKGFSFDNSCFDEDTLNEALLIYIKHHPKGALFALNELYNSSNDSRVKALALYRSTFYVNENEAVKRKIKLYENYPDSKFAPLVLCDLFTSALVNGRAPLALKYGKIHLNRYNDALTTPKVLYFVSLLKKKTLDSSYKDSISRLTADFPGNYYTYRAYAEFINTNFASKRDTEIKPAFELEFPDKTDKKAALFFENLASEGDYDAFDDFRIKNLLIKSWVEYKKGNRAISSVYARDYIKASGGFADQTARALAYPVYYADKINKYSKERNLNPYLILSLIKEESHFDPKITSPVGAAGLMQVMPSTAEMLAKRAYSTEELKDEELNIKLGTKYFEHLMEIFSNNEPLCVLSYNSGPNAVKNWIKENDKLALDIFVETIPYPETKEYIKKVYTAYWNYILTYTGVKIK